MSVINSYMIFIDRNIQKWLTFQRSRNPWRNVEKQDRKISDFYPDLSNYLETHYFKFLKKTIFICTFYFSLPNFKWFFCTFCRLFIHYSLYVPSEHKIKVFFSFLSLIIHFIIYYSPLLLYSSNSSSSLIVNMFNTHARQNHMKYHTIQLNKIYIIFYNAVRCIKNILCVSGHASL